MVCMDLERNMVVACVALNLPVEIRRLVNWRSGFMWPWPGNGRTRTWSLLAAGLLVSIFSLSRFIFSLLEEVEVFEFKVVLFICRKMFSLLSRINYMGCAYLVKIQ